MSGPERTRLQDRAIEVNLPIAYSIARRYGDRGEPLADLEQAAAVGLVKAVRRYDASLDHDFLTYAVPTITGEVKRHFRDYAWTVRPPRRIQEAQARISAAGEELTTTLGRSPTRPEVADHIGIGEPVVVEALSARGCFTPTSLDATTADTDTLPLHLSIGVQEDGYAVAETQVALRPALDQLSARDRRILHLRVDNGWTQTQIADELGVSQMQVSRLLGRIHGVLREAVA